MLEALDSVGHSGDAFCEAWNTSLDALAMGTSLAYCRHTMTVFLLSSLPLLSAPNDREEEEKRINQGMILCISVNQLGVV